MTADPSADAIEHAFAELKALYRDTPSRPPRHPTPGTMRGIDHYGPFDLITAMARGAEWFQRMHRFWPSLNRPRSFSEHLYRSKYLGEFPIPSLGDKLVARDWVARRASADLLPKLWWVGTDLREAVALDLPPGEYFLKASHGSGLNRRLQLPEAFATDLEALIQKTRTWLRWEWGRNHGEWQYSGFARRLFIEAFIDFGGSGEAPSDYKFYCFDGKVRLIHVDVSRAAGHKRSLYTPNWQHLPIRLTYPNQPTPRPACLDEMIAIAETLSAGLRFVRVDLYTDGISAIRFGELTLTPGNAVERFSDPDFDLTLGRYFDFEPGAPDPVAAWLMTR